MKILIDSVYIHESGGKRILDYFLTELIKRIDTNTDIVLLSDVRHKDLRMPPISKTVENIAVKNSEKYRRIAYQNEISKGIQKIITLNNLPPPIPVRDSSVFIYFHNILLLDSRNSGMGTSDRIKLLVKRMYIRFVNRSSYKWIVQTGLVINQLKKSVIYKGNEVEIMPFYETIFKKIERQVGGESPSFAYVATDLPHKNHKLLLSTWLLLAEKYDWEPKLYLTIKPGPNSSILKQLGTATYSKLNIENLGVVSTTELQKLYSSCDYILFPSRKESFGLPLIEAIQAGCQVLAADLPYVHEIVTPSAVYNNQTLLPLLLKIRCGYQLPESKLKVENKIHELLNFILN